MKNETRAARGKGGPQRLRLGKAVLDAGRGGGFGLETIDSHLMDDYMVASALLLAALVGLAVVLMFFWGALALRELLRIRIKERVSDAMTSGDYVDIKNRF
jgi:hypothetical protein